MNYQKIHDKLIFRAKHRSLDCYTESHHITPRCMGGGDEKENIAILTAAEHYIIHLLLTKLHPTNYRLAYAAHMMATCKNKFRLYRSTSRSYSWIKKRLSRQILMQCGTCECEFKVCESKSIKVKYCSTKCHGIARRKVVTISCYHCKESFDIKPSLVHKQQFCSLLCWNNFKSTSIVKKCECCNTDFTISLYKKEKAKYCSSKCFGISAKRRCQLLCEVCGNIFSVPNSRASKSKYCSRKCSSQSRKLAL